MLKRSLQLVVVLLAVLMGTTTGLLAQETTGSIVGSVRDSAGAAVNGATVTITIPSQGNRLLRTLTTTDDGNFSAPNIPTNTYAVTVEAPNFKKAVQTDIKLEVGQRRPVDFVLEAGNISEVVTIQADAVAVESTTSTNSTSITGDQARELSVNNRNWIQFVTLAPGVTNNLPDLVPVGSFSPDGSPAIASISVNGARQSQNTFTVDGADITDRGSNITLQAFPSVDSIGELKVLRSLYPAESGRSGGGQVNIVTRSGTDKFHGAFFEFVRNERFNARSFLTNRTFPLGREGDDCEPPNTQTSPACIANGKAKRPPFRYNNYGFTIGGPVYFLNFGERDEGEGMFGRVPRTYFFFSEEQRKDRRYSSLTGVVPNANMRNGIFSVPICLSAVMPTTTTRQCTAILPAGTPMPTSLMNSASRQYLQYIFQREPLPTTGLTTFAPAVSTFDFRQELIKIDTSFTRNWSGYYRYQRDKIPALAPNSVFGTPCNVAGTCPAITDSPGRTHTAQTTYVVSPKLIIEGRFTRAYGAINIDTGGLMNIANSPVAVAKPYNVDDDRVPHVALTNLSTKQAFGPYRNFSTKADWGGSVTWINGNHTMKFGGNYSRYRKNEDNGLGGTGQGSFTAFFNTITTSPVRGSVCVDTAGTAIACPTGTQTTEQNFANFLLGNNVNFTQTKFRLTADFRQFNLEGYIQDEYRFKPTVTLYAGVRYSYFAPPYAANGLLSNFVPQLWNPSQAPTVDFAGNRTGGNWCNGIILNTQNYTTGPPSYNCTPLQSPYGKYIYKPQKRNFAPRVGIAWDISGSSKTVLRMGYGIYHEQTLVGHIETHLGSNPPYQETCTINTAGGTVSNPVPGGVCTPTAPSANIPGIIRGVDLDYKTPYMQHWSADVQHIFGTKTKVQIGYYGSKGTHLIGVQDINLLPSGYALTQNCRRTSATTLAPCQLRDATTNLPIPITTTAESLILDQIRPYRGWRGISMVSPRFNSNYHSMQLSVDRQLRKDSKMGLAYTWAKNLTDNQSDRSNAPQNVYDIRAERGRAFLDRRHVLTINYVYVLPFYKSQQGFVGKTLGGWQASGIWTAQSGLPFTPTFSGFDPAGNGFINASSPAGGRPYVIAGQDPNAGPRTFERWFNTAAFQTSLPSPLVYPAVSGNAGRGIITGPPLYRMDFTLTKNIAFNETMRLQLKGEMFNVFNRTNFTSIAVAASTPSTFGTVTGTRDPRTMQLGIKFLF